MPAGQKSRRAAYELGSDLGNKKILLVDDNPDAADSLADLLKVLGYDVKVAYDAPQALVCAQSFSADIAILDIGLPVMDGYELGRRLREKSAKPLRTIALTGYGTEADRARSIAEGFDAHFTKPIEVDVLLAQL